MSGLDDPAVQELWHAYVAATGADAGSLGAVVQFGDSPAMADELLELVLSGPKRATAGLLSDFTRAGEPVPAVGGHWIVTDGAGTPCAVLQTTEIRVGPLDGVDDAFAWDEGEGDRTRNWWLAAHRRYFRRQGQRLGSAFDEAAEPVVFERFRVVWPPAHADD